MTAVRARTRASTPPGDWTPGSAAPDTARETPALSVIMPVWNSEAFVAEAIESILSQTFDDFEFLVFDDGSTDGTSAILEHYAGVDTRIRIFRRPHAGYVRRLNEALAESRAELVARMDSDDVARPDRFEKQVAFLRDRRDCVAVGSAVLCVDPERAPIQVQRFETDPARVERDALAGELGVICHPAAMMRRDALAEVRGYREALEPLEDVDLFLRLAEVGRLANLPDIGLEYRLHPASVCHRRMESRRDIADGIITDARRRRGLPPLGASVWRYEHASGAGRHRAWALLAIGSGFRDTAWKHAWKALQEQPLAAAGWLVLARLAMPNAAVQLLRRSRRVLGWWDGAMGRADRPAGKAAPAP
jgi:glycosyltransferase involved in cell wall biosynthesis